MSKGSKRIPTLIVFSLCALFLILPEIGKGGVKIETQDIEIRLSPQIPEENLTLRWSPKGEKLMLRDVGEGFETELMLGAESNPPIRLRMEKSEDQKYFDLLFIDRNHNGDFDDESPIMTEPKEIRGKIWSSFETVVDVSVENPWDDGLISNPYPLSFWYVEDPNQDDSEKVLRFSRRGWMQGSVVIEGTDANVLLTESLMDGIFDRDDSWAMVPGNETALLYEIGSARSCYQHTWLKDRAFRIKEIHSSGRKLVLEAYDPGISREEEERKNDVLAADREAPRSGKNVAFFHDFQAAEAQSLEQNKPLFIDFETTWCGPCKTMDKLVYTADAVVAASESVISVKVDGDEHPDIVKRFDVKAYPTIVLMSADGRILKKAVGYQSVKEMVEFLKID